MRKFAGKAIALSLVAAMCFGAAACKKDCGGNGGENRVDVWAAYGTEKILRDLDYSSRHGEKTLKINAFREEYESAQIILTPEKDVKEYSLALADLSDGAGNVLKKESFAVYNQKYINVSEIKDSESQTGAGYYPDALLPYETAVKYGENTVAGGRNQGIWITLKTGADQPAGTYTGAFKVTADGEEYSVPVSVTVYDFNLTGVTHSKSSFLVNAEELALGELDCTNEMISSYHEFFLEHRISPNHLRSGDLYGVLEGKSLERFVDAAETAARDPRQSNFHITYAMGNANITVDGKAVSIQTFDASLFENTLRAMAARSFEKKVNLFKKAATYFVFFDEYDANKKADTANYSLRTADELCKRVAEELASEYSDAEDDFRAEVLRDLAGIRHKCVGSLTVNLTSKATMVPTIDAYHTAEGRKKYADWAEKNYGAEAEMWTYTCMNPDPPFPSYHLEDVLISSRLLSWMMYDYNITGNLYWDTTLYSYSNGYTAEGQLQDYYDTALRFPQANGDGYLVYPGRPYGIKGPVGTVRTQSIRDGNEDYDLLWQLENELYAGRVTGEGFESVLKYLVADLYSGTKCNADRAISETFTNARERLAQLIVLADKTGTAIENVSVNSGKAVFTISTEDGTSIRVNGRTLTGGLAENGKIKYTVEIPLGNETNYFSLTAVKDGKEYPFTLLLGGKVTEKSFGELQSGVTAYTENATIAAEQFEGVNALSLTVAGSELSVKTDMRAFNIDDSVKKMTIDIYADKATVLDLRAKCEKHAAFVRVCEIALAPGWNNVELEVYTLNCEKNGKLNDLRLNFSADGGVSVKLGKLIISGAGGK